MAELSLWLDTYDDIYSDFDSRNYLKRRVSEDFIHELKHALQYRTERAFDLVLLLPEERRNQGDEQVITTNLKSYFETQYSIQADKCKRNLRKGVVLGISGLLLMSIDSFASFKVTHTFLQVLLRVIAEPAGWFLLWASFDFLFYDRKALKKERRFFKELAELNIHFKSS